MKRRQVLQAALGAAVAATLPGAQAMADTKPQQAYSVVFELTTADPAEWAKLMNNAENLRKALGTNTSTEIVCHGDGLKMLETKVPNRPDDRMKALSDSGAIFAACENTMKREKLTAADLVAYAKPVDAGVAEVVRKQAAGWAYLSR